MASAPTPSLSSTIVNDVTPCSQSMLISVLSRTTVRLLEIRVEYTRKTTITPYLLDESLNATSTETISIEADLSRDRETIDPAPPQFSSIISKMWTIDYADALDPVGEYLEFIDIQSFALQVAQQYPTLGHFGVCLPRLYTSQLYWEVIRSSESTQVSLLNVGDVGYARRMFWRAPEEISE